jgi:hypothetical protein
MQQKQSNEHSRDVQSEDGTHVPVDIQELRARRLGWASLICVLPFPVIFWGMMTFDEVCGPFGPAPPGTRTTVALLFTMSSFVAVVLALCSLSVRVRATALIGLIVGAVEVAVCLVFSG